MAFLSEKLISASGGVQEETDDSFNLVTSLYNFDGSNGAQNNTFLDSSDSGHTLTRNGNTTQGTFSPFSAEEGKWSASFDGTDDYLQIADSSDLEIASSEFTMECWFFQRADSGSGSSSHTLLSKWDNDGRKEFILRITENSSNQVLHWLSSSDGSSNDANFYGNTVITNNEWHHAAATRDSSNTIRLFLDGVLQSSTASQSSTYTGTHEFMIGANGTSGIQQYMDGFISNVRFIKGTALYTSTFTPSASPLTAVTNTKLLTCCSNRFYDKSTSAHGVTPINGAAIKPFSPFAPSAAYDSAVNGGSGYFDGSGDYLRLPTSNDFDFAGSFTIEAWVYLENLSTSRTILATCGNIGGRGGLYFGTNGNNLIFFQFITNTTLITSSSSIIKHQWNHVAAVRHGVSITLYINGTSVGNTTFSNSFSGDSANGGIGDYYENGGYGLLGYMSDMRVVNGTAMYTSNFTPPTAPLTKVTNTKLLANFTNAAMFDQSGKTNVETVGNAQLDTSVKKFGTASAEFDHTGDYLTLPPSSFIPIGSSDFTIECFVYHTSTPNGNGQGYFQLSNGYLNSQVRGPAAGAEGNNGKWTMFAGTTQYTHTGLPQINTWYHVAMVRNSGTTKLYVDGTEYLSASDTTNYTDTYFLIGGWYSTAYLMDGYIDEFRISLKARYTSNFTAPTKEFPNR